MQEAHILRADGDAGVCVAERISLTGGAILAKIAALRQSPLTFQYGKQTGAAAMET